MMASVATLTMAARGGHALVLARTGQMATVARRLAMARRRPPAPSGHRWPPPLATTPPAIPTQDGRRSHVRLASVARSLTKGQEAGQ